MSANQSESRERLARLRGFLRTDPGNANLLREAAEVALKCAEFRQARELLDSAIGAHPADGSFRFQLGTLSLAEGRYGDAEAIFEALWKGGQDHPAIRYNLAYAQLHGQRYAQAREVLETLSEADWAAVPDAHKLYAHACHHTDEPAKGIPHLNTLLAERKDDAEAWGLLAMVQYDADEKDDDAIASAEQALKLRPDEPNALLALGSVWLGRQDPDRTLEFLQPLVEGRPTNGRAWSGIAFAHLLKFDHAGAMTAFENATKHMPDHIGTWHGLAWLQILQGDLKGARHSLDKALEIDRNFGETHGGLAVLAVLQGRTDEAEPLIRRALGLNRLSFSAHFARSLLLGSKGRKDEAQAIVQKLLASSVDGKGPPIKDLVAQTMARQGKPAKPGRPR